MASEIDSNSNSGSQDPYTTLGIEVGATFDEIQKAKEERLLEVAEDPLAKAKIEASYDALLMVSLKERQLGKVSNAAVNASKREELNSESGSGIEGSLLTRLKRFNVSNKEGSGEGLIPNLTLPTGQGLTIRIAFALLAIVLTLVSPKESLQIILSLSTLGLFISQVRRGRKPIPSLGWSVVLLSIGLILGGFLVNGFHDSSIQTISITKEQLEALPAVVLVWIGALLLD